MCDRERGRVVELENLMYRGLGSCVRYPLRMNVLEKERESS